MLEETFTRADRFRRGAPERDGQGAYGMAGEGQQVQRGQDGRQILTAVPEVVLQIIPLIFQGVSLSEFLCDRFGFTAFVTRF